MESATGENEKRLLAATVRERLIGNKNVILYKELLNKKIPTFLKNYLQNSVQKFIHTEEPVQFNNSKRFDFEYDRIKQLKNSLSKAFEEATIFSRDELIEIINKTVRLQFDLIVRPGATLIKIFYKNKSDRIQNEILQILEGLNDRRIFIKTLIKNIKEFDQYHIVEEDFKNIVYQTEEEVYQKDFLSAFISDISILVDFLGLIHGFENKKINIELVKLMLIERNFKHYINAFDSDRENTIDVEEISSLLKNFKNNEKSIDDSRLDLDEIEKFIMVPAKENRSDQGLEQRFELYKDEIEQSFENIGVNNEKLSQLNETNDHKITKVSKSKKIRKHPKITNIGKDPLDMIIERSKIEAQPEGPLYSLKVLIDEKSRKLITKKIFNKDEQAYNRFIKQLESIDNWKEAKKLIDNELLMRSVEPFSKEALRLGDLVFNRYFPKKH